MCLVLQFLLNLEGNNQINTSFVRIRCHYITPYLTSSEECELLSRLPDPMSVCSLSLPFFLAFSGFFPPVNTACVAHVIYMWAGGRRRCDGAHGFVWREARVRARPGSASSRLLYVEKALAGAGRMFRRDSWRNCQRRKDSPLRRTCEERDRWRRKDDHACFTRVRVSRILSRARAHICLAIAINSSRVDSMAVFVTSANLICN